MIPPIHNSQPVNVREAAQPPSEPKHDPRAQARPVAKSGEVSQDQVTLKSAGQSDFDSR